MGESHGFLEPYDLLLLLAGAGLLLIILGRRLFERLNLNSTWVYLATGIIAGLLLDGAPEDPLQAIPVLERTAEFAVIVGLIVLGIRIGRPLSWSGWRATVRLVLLVMPATVLLIALAGVWLLGLALGPALLLGAILAPTDPILAGPLEEEHLEDESDDRFGLSSEAGLNDGFAFPFIYLGLYLTWQPQEWTTWIGYWVARDLLYAVALALPAGWYLGRLCGRRYVHQREDHGVSRKRHMLLPIALLLAVYGSVEALGAYGFLAAFTAGLGFRRAVHGHRRTLSQFAHFSESVDEFAKAAVLIMLGAIVPWSDMLAMGWMLPSFVLVLILVLRPATTMLFTVRGGFRLLDRAYWSWFGIRGIGSVYYMSYAIDRGMEDALARTLLAVTAGTILVSVVLHGLTVRPFLHRFKGEEEVEE